MLEQAFRPFLEMLNQTGNIKHIEGEFTSPEKLFQTDILAKLDASYTGMYAIFLYDLRHDQGVAAYLQSGSLGNDSTSRVLVLYEKTPRSRRNSAMADLGITLHEENPAVAFARGLFPGKPLMLPGVLLLKRLACASDAVYAPLQGNQEAVTVIVRKLFAELSAAIDGADFSTATFGERVGKVLDLAHIQHQRSEPLKINDHVRKFLLLVWKHKRDLMAIVPVLGNMVRAPGKKEGD